MAIAFPHWAISWVLLGPSWLNGWKGACTGCGIRWVSWWPHLLPLGYTQCSLQSTAWVSPVSTTVHIEETLGHLTWGLHLMYKETKRGAEGTCSIFRVWMCEREWVPRICSAPATILFAFLQRHSTLAKTTAHGPRGSFCTRAERGQVTGSNTRKGRCYFCQWHEALALQPTLVLTGPGVEVSKAHIFSASEESEHPETSRTGRDSPGRFVTLVHWVSLALWNLSIKHNFHAL